MDRKARYDRDGYVPLPGLLTAEEVAVLRAEVARISALDSDCVFREGEDGTAKTMFRMHEADGPTASAPFRALARSPRVLGLAQELLADDALYLHHTKVNMKGAIEGSVWPWHQDFGSWSRDGIADPDMVTIMVMLDDATEFSGCLHLLPGSHRDGLVEPRLDATTAYTFWSLPPGQVREALTETEPVTLSGKAGDGAAFHCNLFHASGHNLSANDRWQAYFCFNRCANRPQDVPEPRPDYVRSTNWQPLSLLG
ncbi:MAG: phytanoyl-CoA dioxygenase family protein [Alphaproteobacteria bacterium]|nr:phytanoyl-CoA dioxygenase family protein [Alphaproteobacteria bacterium]